MSSVYGKGNVASVYLSINIRNVSINIVVWARRGTNSHTARPWSPHLKPKIGFPILIRYSDVHVSGRASTCRVVVRRLTGVWTYRLSLAFLDDTRHAKHDTVKPAPQPPLIPRGAAALAAAAVW